METVFGIIFAIIAWVLCIALYLILIGASLFIGSVGGVFIGIFKGFRNYFVSLFGNIGAGR